MQLSGRIEPDRPATTHRISAAGALCAMVVAFAVVIVGVALLAGRGRDEFGGGSIDRLGRSGDCASTSTLQIGGYEDAQHRDAAARSVEARQRPRVFGTVFTWRQFTICLQADEASSDGALRDGIVHSLDSVGAR